MTSWANSWMVWPADYSERAPQWTIATAAAYDMQIELEGCPKEQGSQNEGGSQGTGERQLCVLSFLNFVNPRFDSCLSPLAPPLVPSLGKDPS